MCSDHVRRDSPEPADPTGQTPGALWTAVDLAAACSAQTDNPVDAASVVTVQGLCIDSRQVRPGDLFVAVPADLGGRYNTQVSPRDGHDFARSALDRGAVFALCQRLPDDVSRSQVLLVDDVLDALWSLGGAGRDRLSGDCIAVTGSSGKTTFKEFLAAAVAPSVSCHRSEASLNNHLGVPLTLAAIPHQTHTAIVEIGTNHPGEIGPLAALARPTVSVLLNVQDAHIGHFGSTQALTQEKAAISTGLCGRAGFVVHEDVALPRGCPQPTLRFGRSSSCDVRVVSTEGDRAQLAVGGRLRTARVPGGGDHRAETVAAVLAVLLTCEMDLEAGLNLAADLVPAGRGRAEEVGGITLIDDSYNANPGSMAAAIEQLAAWPTKGTSGVRLAILGDMAELGDTSSDRHLEVVNKLQDIQIVAVGSSMKSASAGLPAEQRWATVGAESEVEIDALAERLPQGSVVLVKGSNGVFWQNGFVARLRKRLTMRA